MKVKDLIEELKLLNQESNVWIMEGHPKEPSSFEIELLDETTCQMFHPYGTEKGDYVIK